MPADGLLLIVAVLAAAASWIGNRTPSWMLLTLSFLTYPLIVIGIGAVSFSLADAYMVGIVHVSPGEPIYLDEQAYPLRDALLDVVRGIGFLVLAFLFRDYARRKRLALRN